MAKNGAKGGGRKGAIRGRTQVLLPNGHYAKRDRKTGEILSVKADTKPYKGVVKEPGEAQPLGQEREAIAGQALIAEVLDWGVRTA